MFLVFGCVPVEKKKESHEAHFMLGVSYLRSNDATQALREFLQAEKIEDDDAPLQAALGQAYYMKKSYVEAEKHYFKALKLDKGNPTYQNNLAALYMETERWDDAIRYFEMAARNLLFAHPEMAWTGYGYAWFKKEEHVKAVEAYVQALEINPRFPQAYVRRSEAFVALGQPGKAVADCQKALEIYPDYMLAHYHLAVASMKMRDIDTAIKHFERTAELAPDSEFARQSKSYLLVLK
jgi:Tfp pilus assembly protein PilF